MNIVSYNLNGIRAALKKGLADWIAQNDFDIVCAQETRSLREQIFEEKDLKKIFAPEQPLFEGYYETWFPAQKKGYSGVATFSRREPTNVVRGCGISKYDDEGRILRTDFDDLTILNCYFPSGTSGDERQDVKMEFLNDFFQFATELRRERPQLIVLGDYNIAHNEIDLHDPKSNKNTTGFLPEERAWMNKWFAEGMHDAFRTVSPDVVEYSWWSTRGNARANNKGWRIDYQSVSDALRARVHSVRHASEAQHSDHCPILMSLD
jgi:exodeoxyribonuclease III